MIPDTDNLAISITLLLKATAVVLLFQKRSIGSWLMLFGICTDVLVELIGNSLMKWKRLPGLSVEMNILVQRHWIEVSLLGSFVFALGLVLSVRHFRGLQRRVIELETILSDQQNQPSRSE